MREAVVLRDVVFGLAPNERPADAGSESVLPDVPVTPRKLTAAGAADSVLQAAVSLYQ